MTMTEESRKKSEAMLSLYKSGMTYAEIGKLYDISAVSVRKRCTRIQKNPKPKTIYAGLNFWLNENGLCVKNLAELMGIDGKNRVDNLREKLRGERDLKMGEIERILAITGMMFEECFQKGVES